MFGYDHTTFLGVSVIDTNLLVNAVWQATQSHQSDIAVTNSGASRYHADVSPFGAIESWGDLSPLKSVVEVGAGVGLLSPTGEVHELTADWQQVGEIHVHQMICDCSKVELPEPAPGFRQLTLDDREEMLALAQETDPGPFELNTIKMGNYWGIEEDGRLIAMAGERLRLPGWTEISGVCTRAEARGKGYAQFLVQHLQADLGQAGQNAFLHVRLGSESEQAAIRAYEKVGFRHHRQTLVQIIARVS